jgi:UDP-glucose 4-epimerase
VTTDKKITVVFGATGTLGTYLVDELIESKCPAFAVGGRHVNHAYYEARGIGCTAVNVITGEGFEHLPTKNVGAVVQIAGAMPSRMVGYRPKVYLDVNITGTLNVLEYCRKAGASVYLFAQSHSDVAAYWNTNKLIDADAPRAINYKGDHAVYIISKNAAVDLIEHYHQDYRIRTVTLRLPTIYCFTPMRDMYVNGEKRPVGYLRMVDLAMRSEPIEVWGDPTVRKDIVYVKDFNQMVVRAMACENAQGMYNVGTGVGTSLEEQIRGIVHVFSPEHSPSKIISRPDKPSQNGYLYDINKAARDFSYVPKYDYLSALRDMKLEMQRHRFDHLEGQDVTI